MANTERNTNQSQFFITLAATEELNGKNTIFGKAKFIPFSTLPSVSYTLKIRLQETQSSMCYE